MPPEMLAQAIEGFNEALCGRRDLRLAPDTFAAYLSIRILRRKFGLGTLSDPHVFFGIFRKVIKGAPPSELYTTRRLLLMPLFHDIKTSKAVLLKRGQLSVAVWSVLTFSFHTFPTPEI